MILGTQFKKQLLETRVVGAQFMLPCQPKLYVNISKRLTDLLDPGLLYHQLKPNINKLDMFCLNSILANFPRLYHNK